MGNDELATHGVMPIQRVATAKQASAAISQHIELRKSEHATEMFEYFERRCEVLQLMKTCEVSWARAKLRATITVDTSLYEFARCQTNTSTKQLERPRYRASIPIVDMAALVASAVGAAVPVKGSTFI